MALAPRTFLPDQSFEEIATFLEHLADHLTACPLTQALAPSVHQILADLDACRAERRKLSRALAVLRARAIFVDDQLNDVLDKVKLLLAADKSDAGVAFNSDIFEKKSPSDTRKYILGPQLATMSLWPEKLPKSARPEVQAMAPATKAVTDVGDQIEKDIAAAETALAQFDLNERAAFVDSVNALVKLTFGQLSQIEFAPPSGPLPPGFVDRFILRGTGGRQPTLKELEASLERAGDRVTRLEAEIKERKDKAAGDLKEKQDAALADLTAKAAEAQKAAADAAAALAKLQVEIDKDKPPPAGP